MPTRQNPTLPAGLITSRRRSSWLGRHHFITFTAVAHASIGSLCSIASSSSRLMIIKLATSLAIHWPTCLLQTWLSNSRSRIATWKAEEAQRFLLKNRSIFSPFPQGGAPFDVGAPSFRDLARLLETNISINLKYNIVREEPGRGGWLCTASVGVAIDSVAVVVTADAIALFIGLGAITSLALHCIALTSLFSMKCQTERWASLYRVTIHCLFVIPSVSPIPLFAWPTRGANISRECATNIYQQEEKEKKSLPYQCRMFHRRFPVELAWPPVTEIPNRSWLRLPLLKKYKKI